MNVKMTGMNSKNAIVNPEPVKAKGVIPTPSVKQTLKGFRDFLPEEKRKRDWVQSKIVEVFEAFGFEPLETPTLEYSELLLGKYGDEADKLVYTFEDKGKRQVGLRYDQTVPTARVLGQYQNELPKHFRRYQIQNVFRADKPQKGRYREFTQCDIDIFGAQAGLSDAEILACTYQAYKAIGFDQVTIKVNDRQTLLQTLQPFANEQVDVFSIIQTIDKLDKLPAEKIIQELKNKGIDQAEEALSSIQQAPVSDQLQAIIDQAQKLGVEAESLVFESVLARGLDYYTGMIFEVLIEDYPVGSVGGGGRYDNLIEDLTGTVRPAVGMAFGFDRTVEAAAQLRLIPHVQSTAQVLVTLFDDQLVDQTLTIVARLRQAGIATEVYPGLDKLGKQFKLADQKQIPYAVIIGESEIETETVSLKNLQTGQQEQLKLDQVVAHLSQI